MNLSKGLFRRPIIFLFPPKFYLKMVYRIKMNKKLDLKNPKSFNEKINWLKLYGRQPRYTKMADKYEAREYIKKTIGEQYLVPLIGVYDNANDIPYEKLPDKFILKCNHDSKSSVICWDKSTFDYQKGIDYVNKKLVRNYYYYFREWVYKDINRRIVVEHLLDDGDEKLMDYRIFCFNGQPVMISVDYNKISDFTRHLYTPEWEYIKAGIKYQYAQTRIIKRPKQMDKMLELASKLSAGIPFLRVDMYLVYGKIYAGELTFYPAAGYSQFTPESFDLEFGEKLKLPEMRKRK